MKPSTAFGSGDMDQTKYDLWVTPYLRWFIGHKWGLNDLGLGPIDSVDRFGFRRLDSYYLTWLRKNHKGTDAEARELRVAISWICPEMAAMRDVEIKCFYEGPKSYSQCSVAQDEPPQDACEFSEPEPPIEPEPVTDDKGVDDDDGPGW